MSVYLGDRKVGVNSLKSQFPKNIKYYSFVPFDSVTQTSANYSVAISSTANSQVFLWVQASLFSLSQDDNIGMTVSNANGTLFSVQNSYQTSSDNIIVTTGGFFLSSGSETITINFQSLLANTTYKIEYIRLCIGGSNIVIETNRYIGNEDRVIDFRVNKHSAVPMGDNKLTLSLSCDKKMLAKETPISAPVLIDYKTTTFSDTIAGDPDYMSGSVAEPLYNCYGFYLNSNTNEYEGSYKWFVQRNLTLTHKNPYMINYEADKKTALLGSSSDGLNIDYRPMKTSRGVEVAVAEITVTGVSQVRLTRWTATARSINASITLPNSSISETIEDVAIARWENEVIADYADTVIFIIAGGKLGVSTVYTNSAGTIFTMTNVPCDKIRAFQVDADNIELFCHYGTTWTRYLYTRNPNNTGEFVAGSPTVCLRDWDDIVYINSNIVIYADKDQAYVDSRSNFIT